MKPKFKVGDNCDTEEFGCIVVRAIYRNEIDNTDFIYSVSPLDDLESEWFLQESSLSIPV